RRFSKVPCARCTLSVLGKSSQKKHTLNLYLEKSDSGTASLDALARPLSSSTLLAGASSEEADYEIYYKVSNNEGAARSNKDQLTQNTFDDLKPTTIQLSNGTLFICWQGDITGNSDGFCTTTLNEKSWTAPLLTLRSLRVPGQNSTRPMVR
ncbi:MAG: hypothetical protein JSW29_03790, partial [Candidatus Bathyarchaeota archaeon]